MAEQKYICFRFMLVPIEAHLFAKPSGERQRLRWFAESFLVNRDYRTSHGTEYAVRVTRRQRKLFFGKLSKRFVKEFRRKRPDDIEEAQVEDWPYVDFVCDLRSGHQLLVIRYNTALFRNAMALRRVLTELTNEQLFLRGYEASFNPVVDVRSFWDIVSSSEGVYKLKFDLKSPNLFGAEKSASEALRETQARFNSSGVQVELRNPKAKLQVREEEVESYRDYADAGGGTWELTVRKGKRRRQYNSANRAIRVRIEAEVDAERASILAEALHRFLGML